ncbi:hypothetical protein [Thermosulfurimonas sp. F29]|uniref:hypothetical protein n=1 Tax=Thermosulfurimonas sp. F29 TaxID=2867247 RepID=UPI001C8396CB|nr:hypothetical protein [Thermosulfurimonas sp. F29]MBX6423344.1 hypothetical protein [Thermosulfurimonas sp. F29]
MKRRYRENKRKMPRCGLAILGHRTHTRWERMVRFKRVQRILEWHEAYLRRKYPETASTVPSADSARHQRTGRTVKRQTRAETCS